MAKKETELMVIDDYAIMKAGSEKVIAAIKSNMEGESLSVFDLDTIHVPAGGGTVWEVPNVNGDFDDVKELEAIVISSIPSRSFWADRFEDSGGGTPPDCSSSDMITGHGEPGGVCETCPYNQWGSGAGGNGKACKETRQCFLLLPGNVLPIVLSIPPSSIKKNGFVPYKMRLAGAGIQINQVTTVMTLEKATSKSGITYSRIKFRKGQDLTEEQIARVDDYVKGIKNLITAPAADDDGF